MIRLLTPFDDGFQVFFHLGELQDAVSYALGAGDRFDLEEKSEYVETLLGESFERMEPSLFHGGLEERKKTET